LPTEGNPQGQIFWLDGMAGTGKSTIVQTIACCYHKTKELGASFFCSRSDADCSNVSLIFPTIAFELCSFYPPLRQRVSEAMSKNADLESAFTSMQLEKLIVEPLEAAIRDQGKAFPPCLIVIDALDECKEEGATSTILSALLLSAGRLPPHVKFLISSRPVPKVQQVFRTTGQMEQTNALVLGSIPQDISKNDIHVYLKGRLAHIARSYNLESWPPSMALDQLVERSNGLFIFAATVANFIEDQRASNPRVQLDIVLCAPYTASIKASPYQQLDSLYLTVLHEAFPDIGDGHRAELQSVLGTVVLLFDPLDAESMEGLLGLGKSTVRSKLRCLHSIVTVPEAKGGSIQLIHPSFRDYLTDVNRCDDVNFVVDVRHQHTLLAARCLQVLQTLSPDICNIEDPSLYNKEVVDLPSRIAKHIPAHVRYACRHWASHLANSDIHSLHTLRTLPLLRFCSEQLLNWLEVMSLLGELGGAIAALESAHAVVKVRRLDFSAIPINKRYCFEIERRASRL